MDKLVAASVSRRSSIFDDAQTLSPNLSNPLVDATTPSIHDFTRLPTTRRHRSMKMTIRKRYAKKKSSVRKSPSKTVENGTEMKLRDPATGHFAPGNPGGPGRPRAIDVRRVCEEKASENGVDLEETIWQMVQALLAKAVAGDVQAAKLVLDRLCGPIKQEHFIEREIASPFRTGPPVPEGRSLGEFVEQMHEVAKRQGLLPSAHDEQI